MKSKPPWHISQNHPDSQCQPKSHRLSRLLRCHPEEFNGLVFWNISFSIYRTAAFLVGAACAEHSLSKVGSMFLHICLAFAFTKDWNLKWINGHSFPLLGDSRFLGENMLQKKEKVRKDCTSTSLSPSEVKFDSVNPQPTRDPIRQDWRDEGWVMLGTWLCFHLQLFHLIPQSSVQGMAGIQGGMLPGPLVLLFNRHYLILFSNWYFNGLTSPVQQKTYWFSKEQCRSLVPWSWSLCGDEPQ